MKKWQTYTFVGVVSFAFLGSVWFNHQQTQYNQTCRDKINQIVIPTRLAKQSVLTQTDANLWQKRVKDGINLYLNDALPDYQGRKDGAVFLNVLFPAPTQKPIDSHKEWVKLYEPYTYQFDQFQLIQAPTKHQDGEAMIHLQSVEYKGKKSSWQQAPYIDIHFNQKGYITGGDYYANQKG